VAVANATEEVKAASRWHVGAAADDAVADALEAIALAAEVEGMPAFMG
jgi:hydroxymethylpyrimidine pyrophosphatase-like HAD family hydrolase